ncbi:universal stress protein [Halobellus captivus]|uniref:universal stress protein n=1 Tax=Halobellus captivus TaxID=2592614 RepID=UPI00119EABDA|nr:universal stress protein [Halobellus captivus]
MFRVLLPVDTDKARARRAAEVVTKLPDAAESVQVTILNVHPQLTDVGDRIADPKDWYDEADFPESVAEAETILSRASIDVQKERTYADPAEAILERTSEIEPDLIIMAGRSRTPVGKVLFGSVTQSVLLNADVPVTVVRP